MRDRWINTGTEEDELKPYTEPEIDITDQKRIGMLWTASFYNVISSNSCRARHSFFLWHTYKSRTSHELHYRSAWCELWTKYYTYCSNSKYGCNDTLYQQSDTIHDIVRTSQFSFQQHEIEATLFISNLQRRIEPRTSLITVNYFK